MLKKFINKIIHLTVEQELSKLAYNNEIINNTEFLINRYVNFALPNYLNFSYNNFKKQTLSYVEACRLQNDSYEYLYSKNVSEPCLYNTVYSILIYYLFNEENPIKKDVLLNYLNSFQQSDGFFVDKRISDSPNWNSDWWGKKHLLTHVLMCYKILNSKPKYQLNFLEKFYDIEYLKSFLDNLHPANINDDDNIVCNLGISLQFQNDLFGDKRAEDCLDILFEYLEQKIDSKTGAWGGVGSSKDDLSRAQQRMYHLYLLWLYSKRKIPYIEKVIDLTLNTQQFYGGFSGSKISSACRDIDAIFLLAKLSKFTNYRKSDIELALKKSCIWVLTNYNDDGGAVFERNEPFEYGTKFMFSDTNVSNLFATWFRSVSIAYLCKYLQIQNDFKLLNSPGYMF